jgi:hypothetical protein
LPRSPRHQHACAKLCGPSPDPAPPGRQPSRPSRPLSRTRHRDLSSPCRYRTPTIHRLAVNGVVDTPPRTSLHSPRIHPAPALTLTTSAPRYPASVFNVVAREPGQCPRRGLTVAHWTIHALPNSVCTRACSRTNQSEPVPTAANPASSTIKTASIGATA